MGNLTSEFNYELPECLIAQEFAPARDLSLLLVIKRAGGEILHGHRFRDLPSFLSAGDILVLNDTSVLPSRLFGCKAGTGAKVEFLLLNRSGPFCEVMAKPSRRIREGAVIVFPGAKAEVAGRSGEGMWKLEFGCAGDISALLKNHGMPPLPPYIKKEQDDSVGRRYQTVYARKPGAAAAPTAGLHFTRPLLRGICAMGVVIRTVTLHTGIDTFRPIKKDNYKEHKMWSEHYDLPPETAETINKRSRGQRVVAVGTTVARTLESCCGGDGKVKAGSGRTRIFIYPGYRFRMVDALITNFHPPRSTTLLLTAAFCGSDLLMRAYREAVDKNYRFLSFGDATLII